MAIRRQIVAIDISIRYVGAVIDLAILGLLKESELHGYELKKRLRDIMGPLSSVSFGSLYPALARLEAGGFLKKLAASGMSGSEAVEKMFLATLSRKPTGAELGQLAATMKTGGSEVYQDIFWALLNSNEFIFNH